MKEDRLKTRLKQKYKLDLSEVEDDGVVKIACPSCAENIPAVDININDKIAKCSDCNSVFSIQGDVNSLLISQGHRHELIRPEGIDLFYFGDELDITIQQPVSILEVIMLSIFPMFAFLFALGAMKGKVDVIVPMVLGAIAVIPIISMLFKKRHKIYVNIDREYLSVEWKPKFLNPDKLFKVADVKQIYVSKLNEYFHLNAVIDEGAGQKHVKIISNLKGQGKAKFLEQVIEKYLDIENIPVLEEHK